MKPRKIFIQAIGVAGGALLITFAIFHFPTSTQNSVSDLSVNPSPTLIATNTHDQTATTTIVIAPSPSTSTASTTPTKVPAKTTTTAPVAIVIPIATTAATVVATTTVAITPIDIAPKSIVGLLCYFKTNSAEFTVFGAITGQATGVIIDPEGYILTAKHEIDPIWTAQAYESSSALDETFYNSLSLDYCEVAVPPDGYTLPTAQEIKDWNPGEELGPTRYRAELVFDPPQGTMSATEFNETDFAVLKITGPSEYCTTWYKDCNTTGPFPYSPVLYSTSPPPNSQLLTYGYPAEASPDYANKMFLKGAVGRLTSYDNGDIYFSTIPLVLHWAGTDVIPGRSGSAVYWNGYAVGILYSRTNDEPASQAITMPAIYKVLKDNGWANLLRTN